MRVEPLVDLSDFLFARQVRLARFHVKFSTMAVMVGGLVVEQTVGQTDLGSIGRNEILVEVEG